MGFSTEQKGLSTGVPFKPGPIGQCQICLNKAELGGWEDGRMICEECYQVMLVGAAKKRAAEEEIQGGKMPVDRFELPPAPQQLQQSWTATDSSERERYLDVISKANEALRTRVIERLVREGVFQHDFHKIIRNERWFSVLDLRRIALDVDPNFENPPIAPLVQNKKVKLKGARKCQMKRTPKIRMPQLQPRLQPIPMQEQLELPLQHPA